MKENRFGYKNFIEDQEKISKHYEWVLEQKDNFINELDHLYVALVIELGASKEVEIELKNATIEAQLQEIKSLKKDRDYWKLSFRKQVEASRRL